MGTKSSSIGGAAISCRELHKAYLSAGRNPLVALDDINLEIADGEFVAIVGPSGCGKSTLLNIMAGIDQASAGTITISKGAGDASPDNAVSGRVVNGGPRLGYVFQNDTVLPWKTVHKNIELGLLALKLAPDERARRVRLWLNRVGLAGFEEAHPGQLSGGMRKRVALATAFAHDPDVFFMDEPFAAVDAQTRLKLQEQLLDLWAGQKRTVVFVTHDIEEAILLCDRIVVMSARPGKILVQHHVPIPRPRQIDVVRFKSDFQQLAAQIWRDLKATGDDETEAAE